MGRQKMRPVSPGEVLREQLDELYPKPTRSERSGR